MATDIDQQYVPLNMHTVFLCVVLFCFVSEWLYQVSWWIIMICLSILFEVAWMALVCAIVLARCHWSNHKTTRKLDRWQAATKQNKVRTLFLGIYCRLNCWQYRIVCCPCENTNSNSYIWAPFEYNGRLSEYGDSHYKDKTVVRPSYLYNGNPIMVRGHLYTETVPSSCQPPGSSGTYFV